MENSKLKELKDLVLEAQNNNREAQALLIEKTQNSLLRFTIHLTGKKDLAEDICQETFIKALTQINKLKDPNAFQSWLFQSAKNLYFDHLKKASTRLDDHDFNLDWIGQEEDIGVSQEVVKTLKKLEADERLLLLLVDLEGYSYSEAAQLCSLPESNIPSKLHRIRLKFMDNYKK